MHRDSSSSPSIGTHWLLRRPDQAVVAVLASIGLAAVIGWWIAQGGWQGRLVEVDRAVSPESRSATTRFQVDVNRAHWPELAQLPGIGPVLARRIVESRKTDGPFHKPDDLLRIRGIGPKKLQRIRPYLGTADPAGNVLQWQ